MPIYREFAQLYAKGTYPQFSQRIATLLPSLFDQFNFAPTSILDLACGEGTFAIAMAEQGYSVTGLDKSAEMLKIAETKTKQANLHIDWVQQDIRNLDFLNVFDLVTCWFDSLNYLTDFKDLVSTFNGVNRALQPKGFFLFDLNTIFWLVTLSERYACVVERESEDIFQVHRHSFDSEKNIATFHIIGFIKENGRLFRKINELHYERGYTLDEVREALTESSLTELACWSDLEEQTPPTNESRRMFFVVQKK
jgi:2-polyprenyl-3-methyl-5-hydroxy-6-metoxy-1,4-benzoquinol methylase